MLYYAKSELNKLSNRGDTQDKLNGAILDIIDTLEVTTSGDNNMMAYIMDRSSRLLRLKPLSAIEDNDEEWIFLREDTKNVDTIFGVSKCVKYKVYRHSRCESVLKHIGEDKSIYFTDGDANLFSEDGETWFTDENMNKIKMPYYPPVSPKKFYIKNGKCYPVV